MGDVAKSARPPKRVIVIDDEESANEQPVEKSVKREEEVVPTAQVVELQQEVLKLKDMFQRACRAARTAELRAEAAETRLDSKYGIKETFQSANARADDLEKRLADISAQLEEAKRGADSVFNEKTELARENDALKTELAEVRRSTGAKHEDSVNNKDHARFVGRIELTEKLAGKATRLVEERRKASEDRARYRTRIDELKEKLDHKSDRFDEERRNASDDRARYRARIDELERKLAHKDDRLAEELLFANENQTRIDELMHKLAHKDNRMDDERVNDLTNRLDEERRRANEYRKKLAQYDEGPQPFTYPMSIFKLCRVDSNDSMSYKRARAEILSVINVNGRGTRKGNDNDEINAKLNNCFARLLQMNFLILHCEACNKLVQNNAIIMHFLSNGHKKKLRARNATVSSISLSFWLDKLNPGDQSMQQQQPISAAVRVAARPMQLPAAPANEAFNIFRLCHADTNESMPFVRAHAELFSVIHANEGGSTTELLSHRFAKFPQLLNLVLQCEVCNMTLSHVDIILHFNSKCHKKKAREQNAAVWVPALKNWMDVLKSDSQSMQQPGDAAVSDSQPAATTAASSDESEAPKEIKKEIKDEEIDD